MRNMRNVRNVRNVRIDAACGIVIVVSLVAVLAVAATSAAAAGTVFAASGADRPTAARTNIIAPAPSSAHSSSASSSMNSSSTNSSSATNALLWRVTSKRLQAASYLFGTMHLLCPEHATLAPHVRSALDSSEHVLMELDMDDPETMNAAMTAMMALKTGATAKGARKKRKQIAEQITEPTTLQAALGADFEHVQRVFDDSLGIDIRQFQLAPIEPSLLVLIAVPKLLGCEPVAIESLLVEAVEARRNAASGGKANVRNAAKNLLEITGLETPAEQVRLLAAALASPDAALRRSGKKNGKKNGEKNSEKKRGSNNSDQNKAHASTQVNTELLRLVNDVPSARAQLRALAESYHAERLDDLQTLMDAVPGAGGASAATATAIPESLLAERNRRWVRAITRRIATQRTFIAVGAAHLPAKQGLIALLRREGFVVEPVLAGK
jgi:uncharacterized protein